MMHSDNSLRAFRDRPVVLIVDDEAMIRNLARLTLEREGCFVLTAGNGEEALALSRQYPGIIHVLLTDFNMPKMNGVELIKHVSSERPDTRILMMSGGCDCSSSKFLFLPKPFGTQALVEAVSGAVEVHQH